MKVRFLSLQFFISIIVFFVFSENVCIAKNVQPHYYFSIAAGDVIPTNVRQMKFDKKEDAYSTYKKTVNFSQAIYGDLIPFQEDIENINGLPSFYGWSIQITTSFYPPGYLGVIARNAECPVGYSVINTYYKNLNVYLCEDNISAPEPDCDVCNVKNPAPALGKPILPSSGLEREVEIDYQGQGSNRLFFNRNYRSDRNGWNNNYQIFGINFNSPVIENPGAIACYPGVGSTTGHSYCFPYAGSGQVNDFSVFRGNDRILNFGTSTDLLPTSDINDRVLAQVDVDGNPVGYKVYNSQDDSTEWYDNGGHVTAIVDRNGQSKSFLYSDATTPTSIAPQSGLLVRISDNFGHQINLAYDSNSRMVLMVDLVGNSYSYAYNEPTSIVLPGNVSVDNLTSVTYPDGKKRIYWYNEQNKTAGVNLPYAMTGITDENGIRYATIQYDAAGKATSTELAGGAQKYTVSYPSLYQQSSVIDPLGTTRTYSFQAILGLVRSTGLSQPGPSGGTVSTSIIYDNQSNVASATDFNGVKTTYAYDLTRNLETSRVEAAGTPQARTTTTTWHATYRLPLQIAEPKRITTFAYDASGNLLTKTVQATSDGNGSQGLGATLTGKARVWSYTYNSFGQVLTATGPRTDVNDTTSYSYDGSGNLTTVTNAAGHVTSLSNYDANGRVGTITAPNGDVTNLTYTARGWLSSKTVVTNSVSQTTTYDHDGVGQLIKVTFPDGSYVAYTYDDAHRLTDISDGLGNSIAYTLDLQGNRISEASKDATGALARQVSRVYDSLNNLQQQTGGVQ